LKKYETFIPEHLRAYRPKPIRWLGTLLMRVSGWKITGHFPKEQRVVIVAGPHTSNWDFVLAMSLILSLDVNLHWVGKHSIFKKGFRRILRKMGGIPVNRANPEAFKNEIHNVTEKFKGFIIVISPEGTRKKVERLKSGFLRIANETNSKIMTAGVDFSKKTIELGDFFSSSGDVEKDLKFVKEYFANFTGKYPKLK
jgi:1-acyl-sn-glycerol-3-phosphate acyltransferase